MAKKLASNQLSKILLGQLEKLSFEQMLTLKSEVDKRLTVTKQEAIKKLEEQLKQLKDL